MRQILTRLFFLSLHVEALVHTLCQRGLIFLAVHSLVDAANNAAAGVVDASDVAANAMDGADYEPQASDCVT